MCEPGKFPSEAEMAIGTAPTGKIPHLPVPLHPHMVFVSWTSLLLGNYCLPLTATLALRYGGRELESKPVSHVT